MAKITDEMKEVVGKARGFAIGTATKEGIPNVVPMGFCKVLSDDEILLAKIFEGKTWNNVNANPKVAVSVWDMGSRKGYQFKGDARIETSGSSFEEAVKMVKAMMPQATPKAAVVVKVDSIYVTTPGRDAGKKVS